MFQRWPALVILIAVGGAVWLFVGGGGEPPPTDLPGMELEDPDGTSDPERSLEASPAPDAPDPDSAEDPEGAPSEASPAKDLSIGGLELTVMDRAGRSLAPEGITARVTYVRRPDRPPTHGERDEYTALFRFHRLPPGEVRVYVGGDLVIEGTLTLTIQGGSMSRRTLRVKRAGAIRFDIQHPDRSRPVDVRLSLIDAQEKPVSARYRPHQEGEKIPRPQQGRTVRVPPEGVIYGLKDGTYTLKAVVLKGGAGETTVTVRVGETTSVILPLSE